MINEPTRRIAEQAFSFAYEECKRMGRKGGEGDHIWVSLAMGKQCELIIQECEKYVADQYDECEPWMQPGDLSKYFGIE